MAALKKSLCFLALGVCLSSALIGCSNHSAQPLSRADADRMINQVQSDPRLSPEHKQEMINRLNSQVQK